MRGLFILRLDVDPVRLGGLRLKLKDWRGPGLGIQFLISPMVLEIPGLFSSPYYVGIDYP